MFKIGMMARRSWRPVIGVVVAYAVAVQTLLVVLAGFAIAAQADPSVPAFELCHHEAQDAPVAPSGNPGDTGCKHCIFCFAGAHHGLIASPPVLFQRADFAIAPAVLASDQRRLPRPSPHSIAGPRGPPFGA